MAELNKVKTYNKRLEQLKSERSSFMSYWGELSDYHLAHRGKFLTTKKSQPSRNTKQYNNTSSMAARTLASGMMAGITSPARPWMKLGASTPELNEVAAVKHWLHQVETTMYRVFAQSNTYNSLHALYLELGVFGTASMGVYEDFKDVIRCKTYTIGSYMLGLGANDVVDTFYREYSKTVGQLVKEFGIENVSEQTKNLWNNGSTETAVECVHLIEPNDDRDMISPLARDKAFRSVYYEVGQANNGGKLLRESGFDDFPIMPPRWDVRGDETYSEACPGMLTIGDTKALQLGERRKYQALDKMLNPPMQGPATLKSQITGGVPEAGEMIWLPQNSEPMSSIYGNFQPRLDYLQAIQQEVELRIKRGFYEDLFLMLANTDRRQITAREVAEKHEEKLLMLGPVLERLHSELLDGLVNRTFNILQRAGVLPPPPKELANTELAVEYISVLAQAQRMVGITGLERTLGFAMSLVNVWPEARYKIDAMQAIDEFAGAAGISPRVVRPDDETEAMMAAEQQAMAQQQQQQQAAQGVATAKTASEIDTGGENALTDLLRGAGLQ